MDASGRFIEVIDKLGISAYDLEKKYNIKNAQAKISQYRNGTIKSISLEIISKFCEQNKEADASYILSGRSGDVTKVEIELNKIKHVVLETDVDKIYSAINKYLEENNGKPINELTLINTRDIRRMENMLKEVESLMGKISTKISTSQPQKKSNVG